MSNSTCTTIPSNPDILGVGIRVNFYFTMLFLAIIPRMPETEELLNSLYENAGLAGFALLLTAIIQTALIHTNALQLPLSLFDAFFILHILFFLGTGASPMGKYHWTKSRIAMGVLVQFVSVITFTAWGLYVLANVNTFGRHPECNNQIKYVVFFFTIRATAPWLRGVWIAGIVLSAVGLMLSFGWKAIELFEMRRVMKEEQPEAENTNSTTHGEATATRPKKPWSIDISFGLLFSTIYSTIMLELTVHRNTANLQTQPDGTTRNLSSGVIEVDNSWAFGQVLAVVMILANAKEILQFVYGFLAHHRSRPARERQGQTEDMELQIEGHSAPTFHRSRGPSASNVSARDQSTDKVSTGRELQNLDKRNVEVSETIVLSNSQARDQLFGTLRR